MAHVQSQHDAHVVGPWHIQFHSYRVQRNKGAGDEETSAAARALPEDMQRRLLWTMTDAAHPDAVFVLSEDRARLTRGELLGAVNGGAGADGLGDAPHSRWHCRVVSSSFATMLRSANLPGPLGTASGTPGPGAWVPRGAGVRFEGLTCRVRLADRRARVAAPAGAALAEQDECVLSIGNVLAGADRHLGAVVELQYLPLAHLPPDSPLLGSLLVSLLPPNVVPLIVPVPTPDDALQMILPESSAPRTMLAPSQLQEVVPASTQAWLAGIRGERHTREEEHGVPWDDDEAGSLVPPHACVDHLGWDGLELRRRMTFVHLAMLRARGFA